MKKKARVLINMILVILFSLILTLFAVKTKFFSELPQTIDEDLPYDTDEEICQMINSTLEEYLSSFQLEKEWFLYNTDFEKDKELEIKINYYNKYSHFKNIKISYELKSQNIQEELTETEDNLWTGKIDTSKLKPNTYDVLITIQTDCITKTKGLTFNVSSPIYVTWTMDWEGNDVKDTYLEELTQTSKTYGIPITQFFNPYIYTTLTKERQKVLTDWVLYRKENSGDAIGLHLHMYDSIITPLGIDTTTRLAWGDTRPKGYDVPCSEYNQEEFTKIVNWATDQFEKNGLPKTDMFRAGGWYIDEDNLIVLDNLNFNLDSSGRTYYKFGKNSLEGHWTLLSTTQPYQMNTLDQNVTNNPDMDLWEFPNNGGDSWSFSKDQMISRFKLLYPEEIAQKEEIITYITHPHWLNIELPKIKGVFEYLKQHTYSSDNGPVIYTTLDKLYEIKTK